MRAGHVPQWHCEFAWKKDIHNRINNCRNFHRRHIARRNNCVYFSTLATTPVSCNENEEHT